MEELFREETKGLEELVYNGSEVPEGTRMWRMGSSGRMSAEGRINWYPTEHKKRSLEGLPFGLW